MKPNESNSTNVPTQTKTALRVANQSGLATAAAAIQCSNGRVRLMDPYLRKTVFDLKIRVSEALCNCGFLTWHECVHHDNGTEPLCNLQFRLGDQCFHWAIPVRKLNFATTNKNPPAPYIGEPADTTAIAVMDNEDLINLVAETLAPEPTVAPEPREQHGDVDDEQQLVWLRAYRKSCGVWPSRDTIYPDGNAMGYRVHIWRSQYRRGTLDWRIVTQLNDVNFPWYGRSVDWFGRFCELREFLISRGRWPTRATDASESEYSLGAWVANQTRDYRKGTLASNKKWLLDLLNCDWGGYSLKQRKYKTLNARCAS